MAHAKEILAPILMRRRSDVVKVEQIKAKLGDAPASVGVSLLRVGTFRRCAADHVTEALA